MTIGDFTTVEGSDGDLILAAPSDGTDGVTIVIIKGFYNQTYPDAWLVTDQNGNIEQLRDLPAPTSGGGSGGGGPTVSGGGSSDPYSLEVQALLTDYQANLLATLNRIGVVGGVIEDPNYRTDVNQFTFNGVTVDNLTVDGGALTVGASESDQSTLTYVQTGTETYTERTPVYSSANVPAHFEFVAESAPSSGQINVFLGDGDTVGPPETDDGVSGWLYTFRRRRSATCRVMTLRP